LSQIRISGAHLPPSGIRTGPLPTVDHPRMRDGGRWWRAEDSQVEQSPTTPQV